VTDHDCIWCRNKDSRRDQRFGRMIVCPTCGNKRCPKATDHRLDCTGSNEPGQPGSAYGGGGPSRFTHPVWESREPSSVCQDEDVPHETDAPPTPGELAAAKAARPVLKMHFTLATWLLAGCVGAAVGHPLALLIAAAVVLVVGIVIYALVYGATLKEHER
jgi:hypothetical protein